MTPKPEVPEPTIPELIVLKVTGRVPPESWNRFGSKLIPKMRSGGEVEVRVEMSCCLQAGVASAIESELLQIRQDLGLSSQIRIEKGSAVGFGV